MHIVLLICELLVGWIAPGAVRSAMQATSARLTGKEEPELPCVNFICECRVPEFKDYLTYEFEKEKSH